MKRGFTLVELLAVIVILAIIALITIPAVMRMIDSSTMNSYRRSVDLYGKAISQAVVSYQTDMVEKGQSSNVTFDNIEPYIEYEGNDVDCKIKQIYSDKTILLTECYVDEELVVAEKNKGYSDENYYYYTNSKKKMKTYEYIHAVEEELKDKNITGTCTISKDKLTCNGQYFTIKSNLENAIEGTLTIENSKVKSYSKLKFETEKKVETNNEVPQIIDEENTSNENNNGNNQQQEKYATLVSDIGATGLSVGDKYTYKVNETNTFNFYVLSIEEDNNVNLIMDRNICENGRPTDLNNVCTYAWYDDGDNPANYNNDTATLGPVTAFSKLYSATKEWTNVPNMNLEYEDEGRKQALLNMQLVNGNITGYMGINITNGIGKIISKKGIENIIQLDNNKLLKARLPKKSEISENCTDYCSNCGLSSYGSCPIWLMENIRYIDIHNNKYEINNNNEVNQNIYGYWLLSSVFTMFGRANYVHSIGEIRYHDVSHTNDVGIRPVITVPISYLE